MPQPSVFSPDSRNTDPCDSYPISAVAKMTGLSVHTIRAWEKRYGVVEPSRTDTQRRVYSREHVRKLRLLGTLVDSGQTISSVANLTVSELEKSVNSSGDQVPGHAPLCPPGCKCATFSHAGVVGPSLIALFQTQAALLPGMDVCQTWDSLESALDAPSSEAPLDLLLVEVDTLFPDRLKRIRELADRSPSARVIVIYGFAPHETVMELNHAARFVALRSPVNAEELRLAAWRPFEPAVSPLPSSADTATEIPDFDEFERIFTPQQLARLARMPVSGHCECPQHLIHLISSLSAFEAYTSECKSRNTNAASLHTRLNLATATARREMELALRHFLETEGIQL